MITLGIQSDVNKIADAFDKLAKGQAAFATSLAINRVADFAKDALRSNMSYVFDRPKPYTLNSLYVKYSTKTNLVARVGHKDRSPVNEYLRTEIEGGVRSNKKLETLIGGQGEFLVPAQKTKLD